MTDKICHYSGTTMAAVRYLHELKFDSRPKLFGFSAPGPVRAQALKSLEGRTQADFLVRHALRDCGYYQPRRRLIESWNKEGHWGIDRLYMRLHGEAAAEDRALVQAVRNLTLLEMYFWNGEEEDGYLDETARLILSRGQADGHLQFISPGARWIKGADSAVFRSDHWSGLAAAVLLRFGFRDEAIDRFLNRLEREQRGDGGWLPDYYRNEAEAGSEDPELPSHPLHTWSYATALAAHPERREQDACRRALEFLLENCFRIVGNYKRSSAALWTRLIEPDWSYSALNLLVLAADLGVGREHPAIERILQWLKGKQKENALWPVSRSRRPYPDEALFLTLKATVVFKRIIDDLGGGESL